MRWPYLEGNDYCDSPKDEYICKQKPVEILIASTGQCVYPCYVYDRDGKLLRVEYPRLKEKGAKWTSRF